MNHTLKIFEGELEVQAKQSVFSFFYIVPYTGIDT